MIIVVTGGRNFNDSTALYAALDALNETSGDHIEEIWNGGMTGADALSSRWAYDRKVNTVCVGARWGDLGPKAGPTRNVEMLTKVTSRWFNNDHEIVVVAFSGGRGTAHCTAEARRRGFRVIEIAGQQ
mgnify:CR=1 FL=1